MRKNHRGPLSRLMTVAGSAGTLALGLALPAMAQEEGVEAQQAEQQAQEAQQEAQEAQQEAQQQQQPEQPQQGQGLETPSAAQPGQGQLGQSALNAPPMQQAQKRSTYSIGTIQGTVNGLDFNRGIISVSSAAGSVNLRARPMDIANLNPGDVVALQFSNYEGALWLVPEETSLQPQNFAQFGTLTGTVNQVNKALGTITVRGQTLRAHPEQLESVIPGQFVSLGYANVSGTNWVAGVQGAGQAGGM